MNSEMAYCVVYTNYNYDYSYNHIYRNNDTRRHLSVLLIGTTVTQIKVEMLRMAPASVTVLTITEIVPNFLLIKQCS